MGRLLCVSATFLAGRYHGQEWPPSPARLVQALVAGVMTGRYRALRTQVEPALRWLEQQPPPDILAVATRPLRGYQLAPPNNDMDAIAREWAAGRDANPAELRTLKPVQPRQMEGNEPHVRYLWNLSEADTGATDRLLSAMRPLSHCMHTLGWGIDMSFADTALVDGLTAGRSHEHWMPSRSGEELAVPAPGFLDDLDLTYQRFVRRASGAGVDADTRPSAYRMQRYVRQGYPSPRCEPFGLHPLPDQKTFSYPWELAMQVAAWLRHGAATALQGEQLPQAWIDEYIHGHRPAGADKSSRMSFVPLPSIGHQNADGRIRRVMLVQPAELEDSALRLLRIKLAGWPAIDERLGSPVCYIGLLADPWTVVRLYTKRARVWRSVTPVVLHGHNSVRGKVSVIKTERLLLRAFEMAGYREDAILRLSFQPAPLWRGTGAAQAIRAPAHLAGYPRYHVEVEFRGEAGGPVLAGIGRHCGLGVFAAAS